ncbi:tetratricopeptide repeat protein [Prosthecobacter fluviatilis]|uniref:Tetratricopeptide repeat protein n=1 Tax=Prosthecobacter fluviatilis TaxID=445931 RepID=A0ABW0KY77_9BACT
MTTHEALRILDLDAPISREDLDRAYEEGAMVWRPDSFAGIAGLQAKAAAKMDELYAAYVWLVALPQDEFPFHAGMSGQTAVEPGENDARQGEVEAALQHTQAEPAAAHEDLPPRLPQNPFSPPPPPLHGYVPDSQEGARAAGGRGRLKGKAGMAAWAAAGVGAAVLVALIYTAGRRGGDHSNPSAAAEAPAAVLSLEDVQALNMTDLEALAQKGHALAQREMGMRYFKGVLAVPNDAEAMRWMEKAAKQGDVEAQVWMSFAWYEGYGVSANKFEAVMWARRAAEQGHPKAEYYLGMYHLLGEGVAKDGDAAMKWLLKSAEQGDDESQVALGLIFSKGVGVPKDDAEAARWFRKAAEQGSGGGQARLGACYFEGYGVPQDVAQAAYWVRKAAEQGNENGQSSLGIYYLMGWGVPKDPVRAEKWLRLGAEGGDTIAQYQLGRILATGEGVRVDKVEAYRWLSLAASHGIAKAEPYLKEVRQEVSIEDLSRLRQSERDWRKRLSKGQRERRNRVGSAPPPDPGAAITTSPKMDMPLPELRVLAEKGDAEAQYWMGSNLQGREGVKQDLPEAVAWHRKAAELGHLMAQHSLGGCCFMGAGTRRDLVEAMRWFSLAGEQGHGASAYFAAVTRSMLTPAQLAVARQKAREFQRGHPAVAAAAQPVAPKEEKPATPVAVLTLPPPVPVRAPEERSSIDSKTLHAHAERGDARAMYWLGVDSATAEFSKSDPTQADYTESVRWFRRSAELGLPDAQLALGRDYTLGAGVKHDEAEGMRWLHLAASQGLAEAQIFLGMFLLKHGHGEQAAEWFRRAAEAGLSEAQWLLGKMLHAGDGVAVDKAAAYGWISASMADHLPDAEARRPEAQKILDDLMHTMSLEEMAAGGSKWRECLDMMHKLPKPVKMPVVAPTGWRQGMPLAQVRALAEQGDAEAQYRMGVCVESGDGVPKDTGAALQWFRHAAERDHGKSKTRMGMACFTGEGDVPKDLVEAMKWFWLAQGADEASDDWLTKAHDATTPQQHDEAYQRGAEFRPIGPRVPLTQSAPVARSAWKMGMPLAETRLLAEQGDAVAQYQVGECCRVGTGMTANEAEAVEWYRKAADRGYAPAQLALGLAFSTGQGVVQDDTLALGCFRLAAAQGAAGAQYSLGCAYKHGDGVVKDPVAAVAWFRKAAEQEHAGGQLEMGRACLAGEGTAKDEAAGAGWLQLASVQALPEAQHELGLAYLNGTGLKQDLEAAVQCFGWAAEQNYAPAQYDLGVCCANGEGVAKDEAAAAEWYRKAAAQGTPAAQFNLGCCYSTGSGVAKDAAAAAQWYRKAAEQGMVEAEFSMGIVCYTGTGAPVDLVEAAKWLLLASAEGHAESTKLAARVRLEMTPEQYAEAERRAAAR